MVFKYQLRFLAAKSHRWDNKSYLLHQGEKYIFRSGHRIDNNLSVRGRVEFENEASASFPSPFASKNIELW
jgi:hypothetical protein